MIHIGQDTVIHGDLFVSDLNGQNKRKICDSGNGYVKFADGTLVCYVASEMKDCASYSTTSFLTSLPATYIDTNYTCLALKKYGGAYWANVFEKVFPVTTDSVNVDAWNEGGSTAENIQYSIVTIGRWR